MKFAALPLLVCCAAYAQTAPPSSPGDELTKMKTELDRNKKTLDDWPNLHRYAADNAKLSAPGPSEQRVVFMGDSITDAWIRLSPKFFADHPGYIDRGISGQTTPQMLIRFRPDVIALKPKAVVILAGTNDIAGNTGPMTLEMIEDNYASMAELAKANGIHVFFTSVMPVCDYIRPQTEKRPPAKIIALNDWMKAYSAKNNHTYVNYYSAMVDDKGMLKKEITIDGLHPNSAGYAVIEPIITQALCQAQLGPGEALCH